MLLLRGSDGDMLHILLLRGSNIYITYGIIRNSSQTLSLQIQKDIPFPNFEFRKLYFLVLEHKTREEAQKAIKHKICNAL